MKIEPKNMFFQKFCFVTHNDVYCVICTSNYVKTISINNVNTV